MICSHLYFMPCEKAKLIGSIFKADPTTFFSFTYNGHSYIAFHALREEEEPPKDVHSLLLKLKRMKYSFSTAKKYFDTIKIFGVSKNILIQR